ncbi:MULTISPECIES: ABC transporter substrate-binding protein [Acidiphilium]|jgi:glycine betaine/proline transport system substrate-binding protein|uniref:Substrate-binding region of ABC-type glycine betaine transport system n=3 Tax=Acidiphilium TaxID=522 RepID=A5FX72_ACICJ|nr:MULTISPECIES: ABC transporter substrate-binding protein [Acidiphilium]ABQ30204.1 Substrate-binding region of ABC-type glycine betaine transport system [Acidiphilium cryptum JF-5]MBU6355583.1 ABC transporter substrate-binding protein [Rhodospirillales bacterium]EGO95853.1 Substrate-binding region of ABC-type glycine betaine transport system [Acidiphilium sp. PM]KDM65728.1 substrate-binding region of ABC-type glycine betaine transport system [Acidiphilium sp. JA12-A1]MBS3022267.1 ABC transpor
MKKYTIGAALASITMSLGIAHAAVPASCKTIRMANIGWTDNVVQNAVFSTVAQALGYKTDINLYSLEVMYAGLSNGKIDVFLDNWTPSQNPTTTPYEKKHEIDVIGPDLKHAKYTLVVPHYLYEKGLKTFADIHKFAKELNYKIYGIEPGNDGNLHILAMIKANKFDLGKFHLVQSSEAGMLAEVARKYPKKKDIVFLGWEPEPMNVEFHINYLTGGRDYFGPHKGEATLYINTRHNYAKDCPNVGVLLHHFYLSVGDENKMMYDVQVKHQEAPAVAAAWLKAHPAWVKKTLDGVTTVDGKPGAAAVLASLKSD